jgi:phosphoribosylaminoimidazolecarboxamide formyltransferase/IMP cyclohydrolase
LKHTNPCGLASSDSLVEAWKAALAGDPISAFGGIIITNRTIDEETAGEINRLFCEVVIAPDFETGALTILQQKKNRILLKQKQFHFPKTQFKSLLNGVVVQDKDMATETSADLKLVTQKAATEQEVKDLIFANRVMKHLKSNGIALAKNSQLIGIGTGQTSRVDALRQAVQKAEVFNFDVEGSVMASDAFFPFPDCVEIAHQAGITAVIQPGGSIRDKDSIECCDKNGVAMVTTGIRHFKH